MAILKGARPTIRSVPRTIHDLSMVTPRRHGSIRIDEQGGGYATLRNFGKIASLAVQTSTAECPVNPATRLIGRAGREVSR